MNIITLHHYAAHVQYEYYNNVGTIVEYQLVFIL